MIGIEMPPGFARGGRLRQTLAPIEWAANRLTAPLRLTPDFLVVGAQKGGTTSLCSHLFRHPQVLPSRKKEIHYFDSAEFNRGPGWYRAHFETARTARNREKEIGRRVITGEASPYYLTHPHSPRRVREMLPTVKLIVMLRDPIDRALSHYNHQVRKNREPLSFADAIDAEEERLAGEYDRMLENENYYSHDYWAYSYLTRSRYVEQLQRWLDHFPREQLLVINSERFFSSPHDEFQRTLEFLGLERLELDSYRKQNTGSYDRMEANLLAQLKEYFRPYNEKLYALLGQTFDW
jgi:hypothetical protein